MGWGRCGGNSQAHCHTFLWISCIIVKKEVAPSKTKWDLLGDRFIGFSKYLPVGDEPDSMRPTFTTWRRELEFFFKKMASG